MNQMIRPIGNAARKFPEDPWGILSEEDLKNTEAYLLAASQKAIERSGPPRDLELARQHLERHLPSGSCWIYACSSHTGSIIDILEAREDINFLGCVDRNAGSIGDFMGHKVVDPQFIIENEFDYILVAHAKCEDEFVEFLTDTGIPEQKIIRLYGNELYRESSINRYITRTLQDFPGPYKNVIISGHSVVSDDNDLKAYFNEQETIVIYYGSPGAYPYQTFQLIDIGQSVGLLLHLLREYDPKNIYLRTFFDENMTSFLLRKQHPNSILINEMFDMSIVFPEEVLVKWNGWSNEKIKSLRVLEHYSFRHSDLVVSKRGGEHWKKISSIAPEEPLTLFSRIVADVGQEDRGPLGSPARIVYAGYLPPNPKHVGGYYDLYPCFEKIIANGNCIVDIYNAGHHRINDDLYKIYLERDDGGRINYHRSLPYEELIPNLKKYDFGWLHNEKSDIYIYDAAVTIPGRVTGYISAGLPIIIDDEFEFLAALISRFNAGILVPGGATELIPALIRNADYGALCQGVRRLRAYMIKENQDAFRRLQQLVGG